MHRVAYIGSLVGVRSPMPQLRRCSLSVVRTMLQRLVWAAAMVLAAGSSGATEAVAMRYTTAGYQELTPYLSVWRNAPFDATVQEALAAGDRFQASGTEGAALGFGFVRAPVWLRFRVENPGDERRTQVIELAYAHILEVDFFDTREGVVTRAQSVGSARPVFDRPLQGRHTAFSIMLNAGESAEVLLRLNTHHPLIVPLRLWEPQAYVDYSQKDWAVQAWYFGIASAMLAFNFLLFVALRDRIYLLYTVWIISIAMTIGIGVGVAKLFLWPLSTTWASYANAFFDNWSVAALLQFLRVMLNLHQLQAQVDRLFRYLVLFFLVLPLAYLVDFQAMGQFVLTLTLVCGLMVLAVGVYGAYRGQRSAWLFLVAFSTVLAAGIVGSLWGLNLLPTSFWTVYGLQVGSAVEMILLALALADRFNESRRAALQAQRTALLAQEQLVQTLRSSERELEERVSNRTQELQTTLNRLQLAQDELIQSEKLASLGALVAGVAHELNTPIGNVLTVASTLQHESVQLRGAMHSNRLRKSELQDGLQKMQDMAELVLSSSEKAAALVSSFKRVAVDQTSEQKRVFMLAALVGDVVVSLQPTFKTRPVSIVVDIASDIACNSYPGPLGQLLTNLIQNAMLHGFPTPQASGEIRIHGTLVEGHVQLAVADTGVGMSEEVRLRVFDPFFTTRMGQGGSGLGLSIASNIATAVLGGTLKVESEPGHGSRFIATFPPHAPEQGGGEANHWGRSGQ